MRCQMSRIFLTRLLSNTMRLHCVSRCVEKRPHGKFIKEINSCAQIVQESNCMDYIANIWYKSLRVFDWKCFFLILWLNDHHNGLIIIRYIDQAKPMLGNVELHIFANAYLLPSSPEGCLMHGSSVNFNALHVDFWHVLCMDMLV